VFERKRGRPTKKKQEEREATNFSVAINSTPKLSAQLLTVEEVSERLRVHPQTVYSWVRLGRLVPVRIGRAIRFDESTILSGARLNLN
jgi:excisionase family DNA binding protein